MKEGVRRLIRSTEIGDLQDDGIPTEKEIKEAILKKKNGKSTTDWKNEVIKKGGEEMVKFVSPVIEAFWKEEKSPKQWNSGIITNVWKGKGDRELMSNQRGITVSSTISTIAEEIVSNRINKKVRFTQAQAGGRKEGSTADLVFILRSIITVAKKERRDIIVTFYDVVKAYDRADMDDMCYSLYKAGIEDKLWRLMRSLNEELTAKINTKAGLTREIIRETGGKQGGKLMVCLFAKMMDNLAEDMIDNARLGVLVGQTNIPSMLYMDDAVTFAEGYSQQEETLENVNEFSIKHKLEWGPEKCKTMEVGAHKEKKSSWKLGNKTISKCESYKYLGERINRNGKNDENLKERCEKVRNSARAIITCCKSEVMGKIGMRVILQLHESETISAFLYNAETWTLTMSEKKILDQAELYGWKRMIGLPKTTPTAGIVMTVGCLFASIRVEQKQLLYLHKILTKDDTNWTKTMLYTLKEKEIGWAKQIQGLTQKWELELDWDIIKRKSPAEWKREVMKAAEKRNISRLREECSTTSRGETRNKSKTANVFSVINSPSYLRGPDVLITGHDYIPYTRALIMGRYGMLKCANNFSNGHGTRMCEVCGELDNESHRINYCRKWHRTNLCESIDKIDFNDIYSNDTEKCLAVVKIVLSLWDLENGKNEMR